MTVRTTGQSPAPPRRRGDALRSPPPLVVPSDPDGGDPAADFEIGAPADVGDSATTTTTPAEPADGASPAKGEAVEPATVHRETRKEVREARRRRRQLMAVCAIVVAICLVITILIVTMARQRPSGLPALGAPVGTVVAPLLSVPHPSPGHGAVAP
jgi:hypothetical protein